MKKRMVGLFLWHRAAFTLTELLVVVGIIGILLGMALPAIMRVRAASDLVACKSNLRQIGIALHHYHSDYGHLPPRRHSNSLNEPDYVLSWRALLLPYLEQDSDWNTFLKSVSQGQFPHLSPPHTLLAKPLSLFNCPADSRLSSPQLDADNRTVAFCSYLAVVGGNTADGLFAIYGFGRGYRLTDCRDGLSNTVIVGERPPPDTWQAGRWYPAMWTASGRYGVYVWPDNGLLMTQFSNGGGGEACDLQLTYYYGRGKIENPCDRYHFWSLHQVGANFLFGGGEVICIPYDTDKSIMNALATRSGGEVVQMDD